MNSTAKLDSGSSKARKCLGRDNNSGHLQRPNGASCTNNYSDTAKRGHRPLGLQLESRFLASTLHVPMRRQPKGNIVKAQHGNVSSASEWNFFYSYIFNEHSDTAKGSVVIL